jgi:hypothetical protein
MNPDGAIRFILAPPSRRRMFGRGVELFPGAQPVDYVVELLERTIKNAQLTACGSFVGNVNI